MAEARWQGGGWDPRNMGSSSWSLPARGMSLDKLIQSFQISSLLVCRTGIKMSVACSGYRDINKIESAWHCSIMLAQK